MQLAAYLFFQPILTVQVFIDIRRGKHPCILSENFIPNDTLIGTEGRTPLIILTGPNMGGKSTLMRQVGTIAVMAQIVSFKRFNNRVTELNYDLVFN